MLNVYVFQLSNERQLIVETILRTALSDLGYEGNALEEVVNLGLDSRIVDLPIDSEFKDELIYSNRQTLPIEKICQQLGLDISKFN